MHVQFFCGRSESTQGKRKHQILQLSCLSLFGLLGTWIIAVSAVKYNHLQKKIYEFKHVQTKDFSIALKITKNQIKCFKASCYNKENKDVSYGMQFQEKVKEQLIKGLENQYEKKNGPVEGQVGFFDVALCQMSYNNNELIEYLTKRGDAIREDDSKAIKKSNQKISNWAKYASADDDVKQPQRAYITFKTLKAAKFAQELADEEWDQIEILGAKPTLDVLVDPTDIIWEHQRGSETAFKCKQWCFSRCTSIMFANLIFWSLVFTGIGYYSSVGPSYQ